VKFKPNSISQNQLIRWDCTLLCTKIWPYL